MGSSRVRYLAVSVANTAVSHNGGHTVGEECGAGLGTVLTDAEYVTLNTYVHRKGPRTASIIKACTWEQRALKTSTGHDEQANLYQQTGHSGSLLN